MSFDFSKFKEGFNVDMQILRLAIYLIFHQISGSVCL